ncbi:MAG: lipid A export permease/ATP-binding protein MsbA [Magnetococcus sp. WYHC-3]
MSNFHLIQRFFTHVWPFRLPLAVAVLAMLVIAAANGALAWIVQPVLDRLFIAKDRQLLALLPLAMVGLMLLRGVAFFIQFYLMELIGMKVARILQVQLYRHMLALDHSFLTATTTGSLISRTIYDTAILRKATSAITTNLFREILSLLALFGVVFWQDWQLALLALVGLPLAGGIIYVLGKRIRKLAQRSQEIMEEVVAHVEQTLTGINVVKGFGAEAMENARMRRISRRVLDNALDSARVRALTNPAVDLLTGLAVAGVVFVGGSRVVDGVLTTGAFFSFLTALMLAYTPIKRLTTLNNTLQEGLAALKRIFEFLDIPQGITDRPGARVLQRVRGAVCFEGVSFSYGPGRPLVLEDIHLDIAPGETVALVGMSGSGKSTLVHLLPRFYDVTAGRITLDGVDLRECSLRSLRRQIGLVTQDVVLFNDTIAANIAYNGQGVTPESLQQAARDANALEFINALPQGMASNTGDRGVLLSGGQRQRLSIARTLLKDAPVLILDEATSALDNDSESMVQEALERLMRGRTTIVIAHRLSTVRNADRIVVLKAGRIVEVGQHASLLAAGGEYARLYALQFREQAAQEAESA